MAKKRDLERVYAKFSAEVSTYNTEYNEVTLKAFILYWSEPNRSKTKLRYELEKTFELGRRLATWAANQKKFNYTEKPAIFDSWQEARNMINNE